MHGTMTLGPWTRTTCPYCGVGCGVLARRDGDGGVEVRGDPDHPANFGRLCSKGSALAETLSLDDRLLQPTIDGVEVAWENALDHVARRFADTIAEHGPDSVAFYVSGQILTEDYYVANKLMKGFIGSANIDTNSRLCMASSVAGHKRAFGADTVPGSYEDLEQADLVVLVGSNLAWCHPVLHQRLLAARKARGTRIIAIDPRATGTTEDADVHLAIRPGTDVALFNGLFAHMGHAGVFNRDYVVNHTTGLDEALAQAGRLEVEEIARITGLTRREIYDFYDSFTRTERTVTVYSQGVNQSSAGTDKVNAILNCHLSTGRIGRPGMGPFSVTGQPNAMGGREVGGLANMLAAHMELGNADHRRIVQSFWRSPRIADKPGHKAVDLFKAVGDGRIKALWIMATNPVDSIPEADSVRAALQSCPFVVVSDVTAHTDTAPYAHVLLPALAWGEKDGTVTNSERRISRQRAFLPAPGAARPDWWQMAEVARRLGYAETFSYAGPQEIFAEYAALTGSENDGSRDLDISAHSAITPAIYDALEPFVWPAPVGAESASTRFFADGGFFHPGSRRARIVATPYRAPAQMPCDAFPCVLNTGRIRDQWHTMTRTAKSPRLMGHIAEPFVEISPSDAENAGIRPADIAIVESRHGRALLRAIVTQRQPAGSVFAPMHWTGQLASAGRIDAVAGAATDPVSGQPEMKHTPVRVSRLPARWFAFAVTTHRLAVDAIPYFAIAAAKGGMRTELAGIAVPDDWDAFAREILRDSLSPSSEVVSYHDRAVGSFRFAAIESGRLVAALFLSPQPVAVSRIWASGLLSREIGPGDRLRLLAGRAGADRPDPGPIVCSCFEVGAAEITSAVASGRCANVDEVGACLKAGTNCGSCRSEIARLVSATLPAFPQRTLEAS